MIVDILQKAIWSMKRIEHPGHMLVEQEFHNWINTAGFVRNSLNHTTGAATGFDKVGISKVVELAEVIGRDKPEYRKGLTLTDFVNKLADILISQYDNFQEKPIDELFVIMFRSEFDKWFRAETVDRRHFIPCSIIYGKAESFSVGPVEFFHVSNIPPGTFGSSAISPQNDMLLTPFFEAMQKRDANWIAAVHLDGYHPSRSSELANLTVDVAIGILKLTIPRDISERFSRITARTLPPWYSNVSISAGKTTVEVKHAQFAQAIPGKSLNRILKNGHRIIDSGGECLYAFLGLNNVIVKLRQAWCDAVYWFHEGLIEPLDSLAVIKLETAVEVLLRSQSKSGSQKRLE